ncbi:MAG: glycosyltransferase family 4 protein [Candidatus Aenigmatarchaeota archaeon]
MNLIIGIYPETIVNGVKVFCETLYSNLDFKTELVGIWFDEKLKTEDNIIKPTAEKDKTYLKEYFKRYISNKKPELIHINTYAIDIDLINFLFENFEDRIVYTAHGIQPYHNPLNLFIENPEIYKYNFVKKLSELSSLDRSAENTVDDLMKQFKVNLDDYSKRSLSIYSYLIALQKDLIKKSKEVVYVSHHTKEKAKEYYNIDRGIVINNGTDIFEYYEKSKEKYEREAISWRSRYKFDSSVLLLYIGRVDINKGIADLLDAFYNVSKKLENLKLILAGECRDQDLKRKIENNEIFGKSLFIVDDLNRLDRDSVIRLYLASDIVIYPSYRESFALVPIEAVSLGKPVIVREIDNMENYVKEGWAFGFKDVSDLEESIKELSKEISRLRSIPTAPSSLEFSKKIIDSMNYVREKYSIRKTAEEYKNLFRKILREY